MRSLAESPAYRQFIRDRDLALEKLHARAQLRITDLLSSALNTISEKISARLIRNAGSGVIGLRQEVYAVDRDVDGAMAMVFPAMLGVINDLARKSYLLAWAGETEAMGRALRRRMEYRIPPKQHGYDEAQEMIGRMALTLDRLRRDIVDAYQMARVNDLTPNEALDRVENAYPKLKTYRRGPVFLKPVQVREADKPDVQPYGFGILDEETWEDIVHDFTTKHIPATRKPDSVYDVDEEGVTVEWYGWEIEQQLTDNFVSSVREGQVDAAREQGIEDFQWIAVLDNRTDECCQWRDGLTSTQIKTRLQSDKKDDDCRVVVPPAHFNCRCTLAPVTDKEPSDAPYNPQDFEKWLMS